MTLQEALLIDLIGRSLQIQQLERMLDDPAMRLVTLTGPAGVGKTRLAHEVLLRLAPELPTHIVSFASLGDASLLVVRMAKSFSLEPTGTETWESCVIDHLRNQRLLLLLDNLEHLLPIPFLPRLITACPQLQLIITSRVLLHLSDEHILQVQPLPVPPSDSSLTPTELCTYDSVKLLVQRARRVMPDFEVTTDNAAHIAMIVHELDGLPLALELAAARMNTFEPEVLSNRLQDRLSLLIGGPLDKPAHQRTLRSTIAWSYNLLPPEEQRLFRRLSVFQGPVPLEMALAICGDEHDTIERLINLAECSLLQIESGEGGTCSNLESMRIFAVRELTDSGEEYEIRSRLADYCLAETTRIAPDLIGQHQAAAAAAFELLQPHINASLRWLDEHDCAPRYAQLACVLFQFWRLRGLLVEAEYWIQRAVDPRWESLLSDQNRAMAFATAGWIALERGKPERAEQFAETAIDLAATMQDQRILGQAWRVLALVDSRLGNSARAAPRMEQSLQLFRKANDADGMAGALNNLAILALDDGDWQRVIELCRESTTAFQEMGNSHGASHSLDTMGIAQYELGLYDDAMRSTLASLKIDRSVGDARGLAVTLDHVGKIARAQGDLPAAWEAHLAALGYRKQVGDPRGFLVWLQAMAHWLTEAGRAEVSAYILGAVEIARVSSNMPMLRHESADHLATVQGSLRALGEDRFASAIAKGRWASLDDLVEEVRAIADTRAQEILAGSPLLPDGIGERYGLTQREEEILHFLTRRLSDKEIADHLSISARTVNRHVSNLLAKMAVRTRHEAAAMGEQNRIG